MSYTQHQLFNKPKGKKQPRQRQELKYDHRIGEKLKKMGIWNYKPSDRFRGGMPDRYLTGGRWIEFKYVHCKHSVSTLREFSAVQRTTIEELIAHGDEVWVGIFFDTPEGLYVFLSPWWDYKENAHFTLEEVFQDCMRWDDIDRELEDIFHAKN